MHEAIARHAMLGFTLLEMLVVVVIMGILVGTVSVRLQPDARDQLHIEAGRLAQLLELAAQEARLTGHAIAWVSDGFGYRFWRQGGDDLWSEVRDDDALRARTLPHGMVIAGVRNEAGMAQPTLRLEFTPDAAASAFSLDLALDGEHYSITASPVGNVRLAPGQGKTYVDMAAR